MSSLNIIQDQNNIILKEGKGVSPINGPALQHFLKDILLRKERSLVERLRCEIREHEGNGEEKNNFKKFHKWVSYSDMLMPLL